MGDTQSTQVREVRDFYGRQYRVGESDQDLIGRSRRLMLWLPWLAMAAVSLLQYGYGVLVPTLQDVHGWSLIQAMWVLALWAVFQAGVAFPTVWLRDRHPIAPAYPMVAGGLLCLGGLVALGHAGSLGVAVAGYAVLGGTGAGLVYATCVTTVSKWFPESRGARIGVVTGAFAYGSVPFIVVAAVGVDAGNLTTLLDVTGAVLAVVVIGCGLLLRDPPAHWWPAHLDPQAWATDRSLNPSLPKNIPARRQYSPEEALRTGALPVMYLILVSVTSVSLLGIAFLASFTTEMGFGTGAVALAVGALALVNGTGRTLACRVSDRLGRRNTLTAVLTVEGVAQFGLVAAGVTGHPGLLVVFALLAGLGGGAFYPLFGSLVLEYYGENRLLQNYGVVYSGKLFGGLVGIGLGSLVVTSYGYDTAFAAAGCLGLASAAMAALLRNPGRPTLPLPATAGRSTLVQG